jgi:hypothetical protein
MIMNDNNDNILNAFIKLGYKKSIMLKDMSDIIDELSSDNYDLAHKLVETQKKLNTAEAELDAASKHPFRFLLKVCKIIPKRYKNKTYTMKINFFGTGQYDAVEWEFNITVPYNVTEDEVKEVLLKSHKLLDNCLCSDCPEGSECKAEDLYENAGKTPITLLNYICKKYNWEWKHFDFDIDISFF